MIKEYFTDGLIGLAILLSLLRTDLTGINNLINYPEVRDVILGQSVAFSPVNFHQNYRNSLAFNHQKLIDFDNEAFSAWYQNVQNLPRFRIRRDNEIEAFLVNVPLPSSISGQVTVIDNHFQAQTENPNSPIVNNSSTHDNSSQSRLEESSSFLNLEQSTGSDSVSNQAQISNSSSISDATQNNDNVNCPFPGCNLTKEDLDLIEVLWRQDVDLGVGKEVFDQALRLELEKERELEILKQQEKQRAEALAKEKEDRQRQEQANRWLKQNFMRDGETGEWVPLQSEALSNPPVFTNGSVTKQEEENDEFLTLEAALDYISSNVDLEILNKLETDQQAPNLFSADFTNSFINQSPQEEFHDVQVVAPANQLMYQDQQENWTGLVDYLSAANSQDANSSSVSVSILQEETVPMPAVSANATVSSIVADKESTEDFLLQNVTMPAPDMNMTNDLGFLAPADNFTGQPALEPPIDWDLGDFSLFSNLTTGEGDMEASLMNDLDLDRAGNIFMNMDTEIKKDNDAILENEFCQSALTFDDGMTDQDLCDNFDDLEGAVGGSNYSGSDINSAFTKVTQLSESSTDSGFGYQAFSSSSSEGSSYAGSPAGSSHSAQNSSAAFNDTDFDPKGVRTVLSEGHVAHNHTYNTPPGQTPREVKKYAPKETSRKGPQSRDQRRAEELKIPFTMTEIIESPVETFNEMLTKYKLSEQQLALIRDIRRRGKNKVAAQNCRKRKVGAIFTLADEMQDLQKTRDRLRAERAQMERDTRRMKEKFGQLYTQIFQSLRDDQGQPYDPNMYSLQQSSDGNVFLVPRNVTTKTGKTSSSNDSGLTKKRKAFEQ